MSGGGKGKKSSTQTATETVKVPKYLEDELKYGIEETRRLYDEGAPAYFPDQTYADFDPIQTEAQEATLARARDGSPLVDASQDLTQRTIEGEFLQGNPYLDQLLETYGAKANSQVLGTFNRSGRLGSGANVATAQQAVADATLPYLFQNYENERNRQIGASQFAPSLAADDYRDISALSAVGDIRQGQTQRGIDEDVARYNYEAFAPSNWLDQYLNRVNASGANNLTTTTQTQRSTQRSGGGIGQTLGTALTLGSMGLDLYRDFSGGGGSGLPGGGGGGGGSDLDTALKVAQIAATFSDERLKDNITKIGEVDGIDIVSFNYKNDPKTTYSGVIAQNLIDTHPEAVVSDDESGYLKVNYDKIPVNFVKLNS